MGFNSGFKGLILALDGGEWSTSRLSRLPQGKNPDTHEIKSWTVRHFWDKKLSCPYSKSNTVPHVP